MAAPSTLFRFHLNVSDIDRGVYEDLDLRVAMHPSESSLYLLTRVIAFCLNNQPGLEFSPGGLSDPDKPCMSSPDPRGGFVLWIEIGNPNPRKLHKASKAARQVRVYTYKDPQSLLSDLRADPIHRADDLEVYSLNPRALERLATRLARDNVWSIVNTESCLTITGGEWSEQIDVVREPT